MNIYRSVWKQNNVRRVTCQLFERIDEGFLTPMQVLEAALMYMSEADVAEMARICEFIIDADEEESDG